MKPIRQQTGMGLVEMMVALAIAMFLTLGLATFFYNMSQTAKNVQGLPGSNQGLSGLQDSERMAMIFIGNAVESAGFYNYPTSSLNPPLMVRAGMLAPSGNFGSGQGVYGTAGTAAGTDTLSLRYYGNGSTIGGCSGSVTNGTLYTDTFQISKNMLSCTENGSTYNLVSGVSGMTVLYGLGTTANAPSSGTQSGLSSVNQYVTASNVTNWNLVKTVQVTLTFTNPLAKQPGQPATVSFTGIFPVMNGI